MQNKENSLKKIKQPWPTKKAMEQVYELNLWGGKEYDFYSGEGSHQSQIVNPYINVIRTFLTSFENPLIVCDLGCGDFNIGNQLTSYTQQYIGVDIVPSLIKRNQEQFKENNLLFTCLNIVSDELPNADCVILRQVLQHLSNKEIAEIVQKLYNYKYVILTEHIPNIDFIPNKDIISGQGIRIKKKSGVCLLSHPFNLKTKSSKELSNYVLENNKGLIVTILYMMS